MPFRTLTARMNIKTLNPVIKQNEIASGVHSSRTYFMCTLVCFRTGINLTLITLFEVRNIFEENWLCLRFHIVIRLQTIICKLGRAECGSEGRVQVPKGETELHTPRKPKLLCQSIPFSERRMTNNTTDFCSEWFHESGCPCRCNIQWHILGIFLTFFFSSLFPFFLCRQLTHRPQLTTAFDV